MDYTTLKSILIITALTFFSLPNALHADTTTPAKAVAGWVEKIVVENQDFGVKAKLDSGAKTSSIYAEEIEIIEKNDQKWVKFTLVLEDSEGKVHRTAMEKPRSRRVKVKEHDGIHDSRPVVELDFCFDGRHHVTEFSLTNRREYIYGVLLGRRFLKDKVLIDPASTFNTLGKCP